MQEIREVHHYDESPTNVAAIVLGVFLFLAAIVIVLFFWQPWPTQAPAPSSTTIIEGSQPPPPSNPPVIVNPPRTDVNIRNESKTEGGTTQDQGESTTGATSGDESTGGDQ
ncbi:MAG: hypothetical protein HONBIEJF_00791 [Fimbriimonadaceae bacterium]|nr:hypothetical protein [Fimbriimonadaceae bacterium]